MADQVVAPRRGEAIIDNSGVPTLRFLEYLEQVGGQINETLTDTEIDPSSINLTVAKFEQLQQRIEALELFGPAILSRLDALLSRVDVLETSATLPKPASSGQEPDTTVAIQVIGLISDLTQRISDLEMRVN